MSDLILSLISFVVVEYAEDGRVLRRYTPGLHVARAGDGRPRDRALYPRVRIGGNAVGRPDPRAGPPGVPLHHVEHARACHVGEPSGEL